MSINNERSIGHCRGSRYQTHSNGKLRIANSDNKLPPTPSSAALYNLFKQGEQAKIAGHRQLKGNMAPDPLVSHPRSPPSSCSHPSTSKSGLDRLKEPATTVDTAVNAQTRCKHALTPTAYAHAPFPPHPLPLLLCYVTGLAPTTRQKQLRTPCLPCVAAPPCLQCVRGLSWTKNPTGWFL
ncbi:hypothetical protein B0H34DRAFT_252888 [Crassisporium funariophilum]|nr:hypothetical protein B0H34DRAFT_252888 [Crassisporium funariophilum]